MGDGSSPDSLSHAGIWRHISAAASFPTLFSTASGVFGLVAGPLSIPFSRTTEFRVRLFSSLQLMVAPPVCEPGQDTAAVFFSASSPSCARTATVFNSAFAWCHGSGLLTLRLLFFHSSAVPFLISPMSRKVFTGLAWTACPSRCVRSLCSVFQRFSFGRFRFFSETPESSATC